MYNTTFKDNIEFNLNNRIIFTIISALVVKDTKNTQYRYDI